MNNFISKILALALTFVFGISREVAAQYGIITCAYQFKGQVESGLCNTGVEGIKVTVFDASDTNFVPESVLTDANGKFLITITTDDHPQTIPDLTIRVDDIDGDAKGGNYLPQSCTIDISPDNTEKKEQNGWTINVPVLTEPRFLLRKKDELPCGNN